jgi:type II secretory pathway pseudopilin PulG
MNRSGRSRDEGGFTLVELLAICTIIIALFCVIVFTLSGKSAKGLASSCQSNGEALFGVVATFHSDHPTFPVSTGALTGTLDGGPYISAMPHDGNSYAFSIGPSGGIDISINGSAPSPYVLGGPHASCRALLTPSGSHS